MRDMTRRDWLASSVAAAFASGLPARAAASGAPTAPVAVARCGSYGADVTPALNRMFDQLGGLRRIVNGKTVAIKINLTGGPDQRLGTLSQEDTYWTHPAVIGGTIRLMGLARAKRIPLRGSPRATIQPPEE